MPDYKSPPTNLSPGSVVWCYLRDSGGPTQDRSVDQQREVVSEYCIKHGLLLEKVFADVHITGKKDTRDQFREMISLIEHGQKPDGLILWSMARFARNELDSTYYKALIRKRGVIIHSLIDDIPEGKFSHLFEVVIDLGNQSKAEQASWEAQRGLYHMVRQGAVPGTPPFGFLATPIEIVSKEGVKRIRNSWTPDPDKITTVRKIFELRATGASLSEIHKQERLFSGTNQYSYFFRNPIYIGALKYGELTVENYCQPIVDLEIWEAVQKLNEIFDARQNVNAAEGVNHPRRINSPMALSSIAFCGRCGSPLYGHNSPRPDKSRLSDRSYKCTRARRRLDCDLPRIPGPISENAIIAELERIASDPRYLEVIHAELLQRYQASKSTIEERAAETRNKLRKIRAQIKNITNAIADTGHSNALLKRLSELETDQLVAENLLVELQQQEQPRPSELANISDVMKKLIERMKNTETRQQTFRAILQRVIVDRPETNRLQITLNIKIPGAQLPPNQSVSMNMSHQRESNP